MPSSQTFSLRFAMSMLTCVAIVLASLHAEMYYTAIALLCVLALALFLQGKRYVPIASLVCAGAVFWFGIYMMHSESGKSVTVMQSEQNLTRISDALHYYRREHGEYPPAYTCNSDGRRMHSWRVLILPYLGYQNIYDAYDFNEQDEKNCCDYGFRN